MANLVWSADIGKEGIDRIISLQALPLMIDILKRPDKARQRVVLSILARICTGLDSQAQSALDTGIIPIVLRIIQSEENIELLKQALWVLVNLSSNPNVDSRKLIAPGMTAALRKVLRVSADEQVHAASCEILKNLQVYYSKRMQSLRSFL